MTNENSNPQEDLAQKVQELTQANKDIRKELHRARASNKGNIAWKNIYKTERAQLESDVGVLKGRVASLENDNQYALKELSEAKAYFSNFKRNIVKRASVIAGVFALTLGIAGFYTGQAYNLRSTNVYETAPEKKVATEKSIVATPFVEDKVQEPKVEKPSVAEQPIQKSYEMIEENFEKPLIVQPKIAEEKSVVAKKTVNPWKVHNRILFDIVNTAKKYKPVEEPTQEEQQPSIKELFNRRYSN